jgi:phosphoribosylamine--glycine ligase
MKTEKKILLLGNGGREHAIAKALKRSEKYEVQIFGFFSANNPKIAEICNQIYITKEKNFGEFSPEKFSELQAFARKNAVDFAIIGPDNPIGAGAVDALQEIGIKSFAPNKKCAQLESSKGFTRKLLQDYNITGNPEFKNFATGQEAELKKYCTEEISGKFKFVVKDDGLCGGKGVFVQDDHFTTHEEGTQIALDILKKSGKLVIEEKLEGPEFSLMFFADGKTCVAMPSIADHKRAFEGDTGPNTGGMGTISFPGILPFITEKNIEEATEITEKVMKAIKEEVGEDFCGVMYGGFMRTKNGTKLIEYNARFGDPESLNALPLLETDVVDVFESAIHQKLDQIDIKFSPLATVCKYIVPEGYPSKSVKGVEVFVDEEKLQKISGVEVFYASVYEENGKLLLGGSRAIGVVGIDKDFSTAREKANQALDCITGPVFSRKDIGSEELIAARMAMVEN